jgi:hypothetical protein
MAVHEPTLETIEYRIVFVLPDSRQVLAFEMSEGYCLPSVRIPPGTRVAEQLQKAILVGWGLHVLVLDVLSREDGSPCCAVAELLVPDTNSALRAVPIDKIPGSELTEQQRVQLVSSLAGDTKSPFSRVGWIEHAIAWLESATQRKLSSKSEIAQYNAGGAFTLVCFRTEDDWDYWLKATGAPNAHELAITSLLSRLCRSHLPDLIAIRPEWNAWLTSGEATRVVELPAKPYELFRLLEDAIESMAGLQVKTVGRSLDLLEAGAFDQRIHVFQTHSDALFDYLEEAMGQQSSTKVPRLERARLQEIRTLFDDVCRRMEGLDLPETIVHGDMNRGNILVGSGHCQFIDWCEAYLGNPLITLQHLLLFNQVENRDTRDFISRILKGNYTKIMMEVSDPAAISEGFVYMPLLAIASSLYGRGDWLTTPQRDDPRRHTYARNLARHMDQAARSPELLAVLGA